MGQFALSSIVGLLAGLQMDPAGSTISCEDGRIRGPICSLNTHRDIREPRQIPFSAQIDGLSEPGNSGGPLLLLLNEVAEAKDSARFRYNFNFYYDIHLHSNFLCVTENPVLSFSLSCAHRRIKASVGIDFA